MTPAMPSAGASIREDQDVILAFFAMQKHSKKQDAPFSRPFGAIENNAQKLHALRLLPMIVVRNTAHEVLFAQMPKGFGIYLKGGIHMSRRNYPGKRLYRYREGDRRRQKLRKTERKAAKYRRSYTRFVPHQTGQRRVFFDKDDADPASSYIATMTQENASAGLYIQAAEHDALDMALTNAGFGIQFAPMPKADTPYAEPTTPVMRSEPAPAPQAAAEQVRTEPSAVRADIEPVVVQQPEQEVVHHAEKAVPDTAPVEVSAEQPAEAVAEPCEETELPFVYDEPSAASYTKDMDVDTICTLMTEAEAEEIIVPIGTCSGQTLILQSLHQRQPTEEVRFLT